MKKLYQTDFDGYIRKDGCFVFTIIEAAAVIAGKPMSHQKATTMIDGLHAYIKASYDYTCPVLSRSENDKINPGAFVWDSPAVFNSALRLLGDTRKVVYAGRIYMPWEEARGKLSFGERGGDVCILQILTVNGNGHFRMLDYDPWEPGTKMVDLKSLRFYRVVG
jgi:hypothetical protein